MWQGLPFSKGHKLPKAAMGPRPTNCPTASSMYNIGTPHTIIIKKYGMRNTPVKKKVCL